VIDEPRIPEWPEELRVARERTQAVARQLVGLNLHDANELANRCGCHLRLVRRDGKGFTVTADLHARRINIETEGDIVVGTSTG
jgi:hypothetical protein